MSLPAEKGFEIVRRARLSGWGKFPQIECDVSEFAGVDHDHSQSLIARGLGRAYGDSAMNADQTVSLLGSAHLISFDSTLGIIVAEAGLSVHELLRQVVDKGWFLPVTPGTQFVTLGGMVAADVHGKNHHHAGTISNYIDWIEIQGPSGDIHRVSPAMDPDWFFWTCGGMGLTGVIVRMQLRLKRIQNSWIGQQVVRTQNLADTFEAFERYEASEYSVAWIDSSARGPRAGRAVIFLGRHDQDELAGNYVPDRDYSLSMPKLPVRLVGAQTVRCFNFLYYHRHPANTKRVHWRPYFYPLDGLINWNRLYGPRGFSQFQVVFPLSQSHEAISAVLHCVQQSGFASPISVLKRLGSESPGLSFPMEGYTLSLDLPVTATLPRLMSQLIEISIPYSGRFYLAKDAFLTADQLRRSDARIEAFCDFRRARGMSDRFASSQSRRLGL